MTQWKNKFQALDTQTVFANSNNYFFPMAFVDTLLMTFREKYRSSSICLCAYTEYPVCLFYPPSLSLHLCLCLSWHPAVRMCHCSTNAIDLLFFSLTHKQQSFCSSSVSKTSLFQKHTGGAGARHSPAIAGTWVQSPVVTPTGWLRHLH